SLQRSISIDERLQDLLIFGKNSLVNLDTIVKKNSESGISNFTISNLLSKCIDESTDKILNKKQKQAKKESHILKNLIKELSTEPEAPQDSVTRKENAVNFNDLYNNITYTETQNKIINQEVITSYYLLNKALENRYDYYKKSNPKQTA
ncbi:57_t:CDS:1, partial [Racocetra fulgida]